MKQSIAWVLSWSLFWLGDLVSHPMCWTNWLSWIYPIYNTLMCWSSTVQDWGGGHGPWKNTKNNR